MNTAPVQSSPQEVSSRIAGGRRLYLLDVRTPLEFQEVNLTGAQLVPLDQLDATQICRDAGSDCETIVICRSGGRAKKAAEKLATAGMTNVKVMEGGMLAWAAAGLPVNRGQKVISLERQVRIVAGLLILTGSALGTWVHPAFYGLSAFVGAGLTFAGITDWCGMGMLLAKAPWNQASTCATSSGMKAANS